METVELTIELPANIAKSAQAEGLLDPAAIQTMLEREIRRRAARNLLSVAEEMTRAGLPELTTEEAQAEIDAYRAEKRRARANRR